MLSLAQEKFKDINTAYKNINRERVVLEKVECLFFIMGIILQLIIYIAYLKQDNVVVKFSKILIPNWSKKCITNFLQQ